MIRPAILGRCLGPRRWPAPSWPRPRRRNRPRSRWLVSLASVALTACASVKPAAEAPTNPPATAQATPPPQATPSQVANRGKLSAKIHPTQARNEFQRKVTPEQQYNVHLQLGRYQEEQENFEFALAEYQKALEACHPRSLMLGGGRSAAKQALAHRRMGAALDRLGRFDQSEAEYRTALKLSPNDPKVWNDAGYSYYLQRRWADAERALKTADSLEPNNTRILTNLGLTLAASGKTDKALAAFTKAGGQAIGHANLAYILAAMGQEDQALTHYKRALEFQPDLGPARQALAALEAKVGQAAQIAANVKPVAPTPTIPPPVVTRSTIPPPAPMSVAARSTPRLPPLPTRRARPTGRSNPSRTGQVSRASATGSLDADINRASAATPAPTK